MLFGSMSEKAARTYDMLEETLQDQVRGRKYWVLWVGPSTAEEAPHMEEHCGDTVTHTAKSSYKCGTKMTHYYFKVDVDKV